MNSDGAQHESADIEHSISQYIEGLRQGDDDAAQAIWERFFRRLVRLADRKLRASRKAEDEEDLVQKAFADFFLQVQQGRFPKLNDRHDLWQVLGMLVDRRAIDMIRRQNTQKQGAGKVHGESVFLIKDDSVASPGIAGAADDMMPTPELAAEMAEILRERLKHLDSDEHRQVALLKMQGFTNKEIADQLQSSVRTVERWLEKMRQRWSELNVDRESDGSTTAA